MWQLALTQMVRTGVAFLTIKALQSKVPQRAYSHVKHRMKGRRPYKGAKAPHSEGPTEYFDPVTGEIFEE